MEKLEGAREGRQGDEERTASSRVTTVPLNSVLLKVRIASSASVREGYSTILHKKKGSTNQWSLGLEWRDENGNVPNAGVVAVDIGEGDGSSRTSKVLEILEDGMARHGRRRGERRRRR